MFASRNIVIFPNLAIVDLIMGITIRTYYPMQPGLHGGDRLEPAAER